jgi:thiol:disulfide interchange protein DsbD
MILVASSPFRTLRGIATATALMCATSALLPAPASAQEHPIRAELRRSADAVAAGGRFTATLHAIVPSGWHLYSVTQPPGGPVPTTIDIVGPQFKLAGPIDGPIPVSAPDPNFSITSEWYEDSAVFHLPVAVAKTAEGNRTLTVHFGYQTCTARYCLPPRVDTLTLAVRVGAAVVTADVASSTSSSAAADTAGTAAGRVSISQEKLDSAKAGAAAASAQQAGAQAPVQADGFVRGGARSFALFLWIAATMGALALLTPCVFPMVPITISYFSQRKSGQGSAISEAALYAFGIIASFTILGLGLSLLFGVAGLNRFAASAPLNLAVAALFIMFALSLFGLLNIAVPARILTALDSAGRSSRYGRVGTTLLMGATFSVTTFTCTAPFVGTLLVTAASGDWKWPAAGLFVFSTAFALPFFILALVPNALARLPRSGEWLLTMKGALAFIELAAAMKFISNADLVQGWGIFSRTVVLAIWVCLGIMLALYLLGVRSSRWFWHVGAKWHPVAGTAALLVVVWLGSGLAGRRLGELESFLPPANGSGSAGSELPWITDDYDGALARAATENKLVLIDFTGFTCTNCRWMEANMFPRVAVQKELDQFVRVRLFTDGQHERYRAQQKLEQEKFKTVALPLYAVVDATGNSRGTFLGMTRSPEEFIQFLSDARTKR